MDVPIPNLNDSSLILRTTIANHRILWLGDCQEICANRLCQLYDAKNLQCDILQVGHHGYGGGSDALHRAVDPAVKLSADSARNTAILTIDGSVVDSKPYTPVKQHGLYLVLENGTLKLHHIKVTAH